MAGLDIVYLTDVDIVILVIYFAAVIGTSLYAMCSSKRDTADGYFLGGRFMTFIPIGASLFASNIGSEHFLGLSGSGAAAGISVGAYEFSAIFILQLLGFVFVPIYLASGVITLPEYLKKRFGGQRISILLSVLSLVLYVLTKMSVNMMSGALFIKVALGWDIAASLALIIGLSAFCTISGGLAAVIYTDAVQAFLMVAGAITLMAFGFDRIGGFTDLYECFTQARPANVTGDQSCGSPPADSLIMLRDAGDPSTDLPWAGFIFGASTVSIWYWCADQVIVQRTLSAKNLSHAQGATIFAGYMKFLPMFMLVLPGMMARVLYPDVVACGTPEDCQLACGDPTGCTNFAYPYLVMDLMPEGLRGLMVAVMLAALVTALTSIFNSASSLFTVDLYRLMRKNASTREEMIVGRLFVIVMVVLSILWIPLIQGQQGGQLFIYIQAVQGYLCPPIASIFLVAIFWKGANEKGAFWSLLAGMLTGLIGLILSFVYPAPACGQPDDRPAIIADFHFMYFSMLTFFGTIFVMIVISLVTKPDEKWRIIRTVFSTRYDTTVRPDELPINFTDTKEKGKSFEMDEKIDSVNPKLARSLSSSSSSSSSSGKTDNEKLTCSDRLDLPKQTVDPETGEELKGGQKCRLWCLWITGWFCGFSVNDTGKKPERSNAFARHEAENHVKDLVLSLQQDRRSFWFLTANLVVVLALAIFAFTFFTIPPETTGLLVPGSANCSVF